MVSQISDWYLKYSKWFTNAQNGSLNAQNDLPNAQNDFQNDRKVRQMLRIAHLNAQNIITYT